MRERERERLSNVEELNKNGVTKLFKPSSGIFLGYEHLIKIVRERITFG